MYRDEYTLVTEVRVTEVRISVYTSMAWLVLNSSGINLRFFLKGMDMGITKYNRYIFH